MLYKSLASQSREAAVVSVTQTSNLNSRAPNKCINPVKRRLQTVTFGPNLVGGDPEM